MNETLRQAYEQLTKKQTFKMDSPFLVWLLENPRSPLSLPGAISLAQHDYVHCLLGANLKLDGEAFVIGFTMGCDPRMRRYHVWMFQFFSCFLYPRQYRFKMSRHWPLFMKGYALAKASRVRDLEKFDFSNWMDQTVESLRTHFFGPQMPESFSAIP